VPTWLQVRRTGEVARLRICTFYALGCATAAFTVNSPWLFGRTVTVIAWLTTAIMFLVVGFRPGYKRRQLLVVFLSLACSVRAFGSLYPDPMISDFLLRGCVYLMLAVALTRDIASPVIREHERLQHG
jgi:hypothetical protein